MAYMALDVDHLRNLSDNYTQTIADYFNPVIPKGFTLKTSPKIRRVTVTNGVKEVIGVFVGSRLVIVPTGEIKLDKSLMTLATRILEYNKELLQYEVEIKGGMVV